MPFETIQYEVTDHIAHITLNRPDAMNARNNQMRRELIEAYQDVEWNDDVRVLVITGNGRAFCAGRDLKEVATEQTPVVRRHERMRSNDTDVLARITKPVVAAINGFAFGGGLEMALCADIRIMSTTAQVGLTETQRGMIPGAGGTQRLTRVVGPAEALRLILQAERLDAAEALRIGLVHYTVEPAGLADKAREVAGRIAANAPAAVRYGKEAVRKGMDMPLEHALQMEFDLSCLLGTTDDYREGARAFVEKRAPVWQGR